MHDALCVSEWTSWQRYWGQVESLGGLQGKPVRRSLQWCLAEVMRIWSLGGDSGYGNEIKRLQGEREGLIPEIIKRCVDWLSQQWVRMRSREKFPGWLRLGGATHKRNWDWGKEMACSSWNVHFGVSVRSEEWTTTQSQCYSVTLKPRVLMQSVKNAKELHTVFCACL